MHLAHEVWTTLLDLLFPRTQADASFDTLKPEVLAQHARNPHTNLKLQALAPLIYNKPLIRQAVHAAKYHNHARAAALLGVALAPYVAEELAERQAFGSFTLPTVVPVPLHHLREQERGFNQSERIAQVLSTEIGASVLSTALVRVIHTPSQARTGTRSERIENMRHAFRVLEPSMVQGLDIVLVDDVVTTGATLDAAQATLLGAGARAVLCVAVAH